MRIVFMGTPDFAVASLQAIQQSEHTVVAVVTSPDKTGGRGRKQLIESEVKKFALSNNIPVFQPKSLKSGRFVRELTDISADLFVVVAFRMLPEVIWSMPPQGTINLHASLLPQYRGAAPINWAIINGEKKTGVTTFFIEKEIDTGLILQQREVFIGKDENMGQLYNRLKETGAQLLVETLDLIENGDYIPYQQDISRVSEAPKVYFETGEIKHGMTAEEVHNLVRGLNPFPNAWIRKEESLLKIVETQLTDEVLPDQPTALNVLELGVFRKKLFLQCTDLPLEIIQLKPEGKKIMNAGEYINGTRNLLKLNN